MGNDFLRAMLARVVSALGSVFLLFVLGRVYGADGVGVFAISQSIVIGVSTLSRFGMDNSLVRFVGQQPFSINTATYLKWALGKALLISVFSSLVVWLLSGVIENFFSSHDLKNLLLGFSFSIPALTLAFILSGFMKGIRKPVNASFLENGVISFVTGGGVAAQYFIAGSVDFIYFGWMYALSAWVVFFAGLVVYFSWKKRLPVDDIVDDDLVSKKRFNGASLSFFYMSFSMFMQSVFSVLIAAYYLDDGELGLFKSAWQAATLIGFVQVVINTVYPPRFAEAYHKGDVRGLERLAKNSSLVGVVLAAPLFVLFVMFPGKVLSVIGDEFKSAAILLVIMSVGQMVNVASGSVGYLLNMTNNEALMRNISIGCNLMGLLSMLVTVPKVGALGAAVSLALVLIFQNVICMFFAHKRLGVFMLPIMHKKSREI